MKKANEMTGFTLRAGVLAAAVAMALMPRLMPAQITEPPAGSLVLDDFTKGEKTAAENTIKIVSGDKFKTYKEPAIDGHIIGGSRTWEVFLTPAANNPYSQPLRAQVLPDPGNGLPPAFIGWFGYGALGRIYLQYGYKSPLSVNLKAYDRLRVVFAGLTNGLNFNIVAFQGSNNEAGECGINLAPLAAPFTVDFPLDDFVLGTTGVDFSNIQQLVLIFQGAPDLAITGFYAVPAGAPPATFTACPKS
jgi:hypothetical protein